MIRPAPTFPMNKLAEIPSRPNDFRLLERIPLTCGDLALPYSLSEPVGDELVMAIIDFETTGLEVEHCDVIELGMVKVSYSPSAKRITALLDVVSMYEEPTKPIPEFITGLTGISDDMVRGKRLDENAIAEKLSDVELCVAHNAAFDYGYAAKRLPFPVLADMKWACTSSGIYWTELGFGARKLEYLLMWTGSFYESHRASTDCLAVAWLLHVVPEACAMLLDGVELKSMRIAAFGAPYEVKDTLKARGYRWNDGTTGANKHWGIEVAEADFAEESKFLDELYPSAMIKASVVTLDARTRFKGK